MNKLIVTSFLCALAISFTNCTLTCYSNSLGTLSYAPITCSNGISACYKIRIPFTALATTTTGVSYNAAQATSLPFIVGDAGCVPILAAGAASGSIGATPQSTTTQFQLGNQGAGYTTVGLYEDWFTLWFNVCFQFGSCCYTNLCNA